MVFSDEEKIWIVEDGARQILWIWADPMDLGVLGLCGVSSSAKILEI